MDGVNGSGRRFVASKIHEVDSLSILVTCSYTQLSTLNRWRVVVSGTWKYDDPRLKMSHEGACPTNNCVSYVLSYDQLLLQWRNAIESETRDCLPAKNTHSPNYCSCLAICVNYSANFYCKIALISRFKVYLIKILTVTSKRKQKQRRIYITFTM